MDKEVKIPTWACSVILTAVISLSFLVWNKVDAVEEQIVIEKTSRSYIEKKLISMDAKLMEINNKLDQLKEQIRAR